MPYRPSNVGVIHPCVLSCPSVGSPTSWTEHRKFKVQSIGDDYFRRGSGGDNHSKHGAPDHNDTLHGEEQNRV